ncbi:unnamed protein product [Rotaria sordida]|uniref:DNA-directed RNA polymerase n=1 Tax=Rotaria sordida TaxID=392033 RepID=A0A819E079_9BILA|nr:unnamed protein product [Rotaria sordida]CAF3841948.1 unnamed protein product [Rotaria sordida]CAF3886195.1 unnamed protein product [Rotaria sordida]
MQMLYLKHEKFCPNGNTSVRSLRANSHIRLFFYSQGISTKQIKAYQRRIQTKKNININDESIDNVDDQEEMLTKIMFSQMYLTPLDVLKHLEKIWINEREVLASYLPTLRSSNHSIMIVHNNLISSFFFEVSPVLPSKFYLLKMQIIVNSIFDNSLDNRSDSRNVIGKKKGLFRMHMMDKRVNYADQSVISPDPFIATYEVGIPEIFAKKKIILSRISYIT